MEYIADAEKICKPTWYMKALRIKPDYDAAAENYATAAKVFLQKKDYNKAVECYEKAADICIRPSDRVRYEVAILNISNRPDANTNTNIRVLLQRIIDMYLGIGNLARAAQYKKFLADYLLSIEPESCDSICDLYLEAGHLYECENQTVTGEECCILAYHIYAENGKYDKAIAGFDELVQKWVVGKPGTKQTSRIYRVNEFFCKIGLCHLANNDMIGAKRAFQNYDELYGAFANSREGILLDKLIQSCENNDVDMFQEAIHEYDCIKKLDNWMVTILCTIKKSLKNEEMSLV